MNWYDDIIPDIEEELPFLPGGKRKVVAKEEKGQNIKAQETDAFAQGAFDSQDYATYSGRTFKGDTEGVENGELFIHEDDIEVCDGNTVCSERKYIVLIIYDIV